MARDKNDVYQEAMNKGHRLAGVARWSEAANAYRTAVKALPHDATARICLALSLYRGGELTHAYQEYEAALKISPKDTLLLARMADIQHKLGRFDLSADLMLRIAEIHLQQKQREKALNVCRQVYETYSDNKACMELLKKAYAKAGEKQLEAEAELAIAYIYAELADHKQAIQACKRAIELDASNERARQILKSIDNGTADWRSFRLLDQFKGKVDVRKGVPVPERHPSNQVTPPDVPVASSDPTLKPESLREAEAGGESEAARARKTEWYVAESQKYERDGDIISAVAILCKALDNFRSDGGDEVAAVRQRIDSLLAGREQIHIDEFVSLPFEDRRTVLGGMMFIDDCLERGLKLAAIDACLSVIELVPDYLPAQTRLASIYVGDGKVDAARSKYSYVAQLYQLRGNESRAAETMASFVDLCDDDGGLREELATSLMEQGSLDLALNQMMHIVDGYIGRKNFTNALAYLSKMLKLAPNRVDINIRFAELSAQMGTVVEAEDAYARALTVDPNNEDAIIGFTLCSARLDDWLSSQPQLDKFFQRIENDREFAAKSLNRLSEDGESWTDKKEARLCLGATLQSLRRTNEAIETLRPLVGEVGYVGLLGRYFLSICLIANGELGEAVKHLNSGLSYLDDGANSALFGGRGDEGESNHLNWLELSYLRLMKSVYRRLGNKPATLTVLSRIKKTAPSDDEAYLELANLYLDSGQPDAAIQELDQLSKLLLSKGNQKQALASYESIVKRIPNNIAVRRRLHDGYKSLGMMDEAAKQLEVVVELEMAKGMAAEVKEDLQRLIEIYRVSNPRKALLLRERLVKLNPGDVPGRQDLIATYLKMGLVKQGLSEARSLAEHLMAEKRHNEAFRVLLQILKLDPWNVWALEHMAGLLAAAGRQEESVRAYKKLLQIDPQNAAARNYLAGVEG